MPLKNKELKKEYHREYHKKWYAKNKQKHRKRIYKNREKYVVDAEKHIRSVKVNGSCLSCGEKDYACLDFHHLDETKKRFMICEFRRGYKLDTIKKELEKCIILCRNCHAKLHFYGELKNIGVYSRYIKFSQPNPKIQNYEQ